MALADEKQLAIKQLYEITRDRINELTAGYSIFEQVAWSLKLKEAKAIVSNAGHQGLLLAEARATLKYRGVSNPTDEQLGNQLVAMAQGIVNSAESLMQVEAEMVGWRSAKIEEIEGASDELQLARIELKAPI